MRNLNSKKNALKVVSCTVLMVQPRREQRKREREMGETIFRSVSGLHDTIQRDTHKMGVGHRMTRLKILSLLLTYSPFASPHISLLFLLSFDVAVTCRHSFPLSSTAPALILAVTLTHIPLTNKKHSRRDQPITTTKHSLSPHCVSSCVNCQPTRNHGYGVYPMG